MLRRFDADEPVPADELVKVMSLTLGWTKPSRAANLLDRGVREGLLADEEGAYRATFDPQEVDVPFGFSPDAAIFDPVDEGPSSPQAETAQQPDDEAEEDQVPKPGSADAEVGEGTLVDELLDAIAEHVEGGRKRAVAATNAKQAELGGLVTLDAAALLVAKGLGLDVSEDAEAVLEQLREQAG